MPWPVNSSMFRTYFTVVSARPFFSYSFFISCTSVKTFCSSSASPTLKVIFFFSLESFNFLFPSNLISVVRPRITEIKFEGNKKLNDSKLKKKITFKVGEALDEQKVFTDVQEMKKLYEKNGLADTTVKYVLNIEELTGHGIVTFHIEETPKVKIESVAILGATNFKQKELRKELKTKKRWAFSWLTGTG